MLTTLIEHVNVLLVHANPLHVLSVTGHIEHLGRRGIKLDESSLTLDLYTPLVKLQYSCHSQNETTNSMLL